MICRLQYGDPILTEAVVQEIPVTNLVPAYLHIKGEKNDVIQYHMQKDDIVYGLGEANRGINKRGYSYVSCCTDCDCHTEDKLSLYGAHNFILVKGEKTFGLFVDTSECVRFDIGDSDFDELIITVNCGDYNLYVIEETELLDIVKEFRKLIGQSYIAPKWAFGYQQSRWGYRSEDDLRDVVNGYEKEDFPLEAVYMDIDYMERYKDFTLNMETFPEFSDFVKEMQEKEIHLVPIIDAGVKVEKDYPVYEEGVEKEYFCKNEYGENFAAGVWPGKCHFPDFLNPEARAWFGDWYRVLIDQGIDAFWNDMNEPALFYTDERIEKAFEYMDSLKGKDLGVDLVFEMRNVMNQLANNVEDYKRIFHKVGDKLVSHNHVHNLYGYNMTRAAREAFDKNYPDKEILLFSRASYIGAHRYGGVWTGDNCSWWSHLLLNIKMMPSLNMCGFLYSGADIGGFNSNVTEDLMIRWLQFGIFTPLFRNHSALGTRNQELYLFKDKDTIRNILQLRYSLIPYLYSEYCKAIRENDMLFKPLSFVYTDDKHCEQVEDELLLGESILLAPVYEQNAKGRYVYLPEDMLCVKYRGLDDMEQIEYIKGHHYIEVALNELIFFVRPGHLLPMAGKANRVSQIDYNKLNVIGYKAEGVEYQMCTGWERKNGLSEPRMECYTLNGLKTRK